MSKFVILRAGRKRFNIEKKYWKHRELNVLLLNARQMMRF